jgi:hypothetical protein
MQIGLEHVALDNLDMRAIPVLLLQFLGESAIDLHRDEPSASFNKDVR